MKTKSQNGSLLVTMLFVFALLAVVGSILSLSLTAHRLSMRSGFGAQARAVGESELEHLFYLFKSKVESGVLPPNVPAALVGQVDDADVPITIGRAAHLSYHRDEGWTVNRSMHAVATYSGLDDNGNMAEVSYVDVKLEVVPPPGSPWLGGPPVRYGRQFEVRVATIFQNCVFYQNDLEMAPGEDTDISGDIVCNRSIYMGANGATLRIMRKVKVLGGFNTRGPGPDGAYNMAPGDDRILGTLDDAGDDINPWVTLRNPITGSVGFLSPPTFLYSLGEQLQQLDKAVNLFGGKDPDAVYAYDLTHNPNLFPAVNDVYRSLIVPPPAKGGLNEYPTAVAADDAVMSAQRLYNRADLIVTIEGNAVVSITKRDGTVLAVSDYNLAVTTKNPDNTDIQLKDLRENRTIHVTNIDLGVLRTLVGTDGPTANQDFKGLLYVNLKDADSAVRLVNAELVPRTGDGTGGFSVVTNGGLYVQGSYNTKKTDGSTITDIPTNTSPPRSMLLADALTVLSKDWDDTKSFSTVTNPPDDVAKLGYRIAAHDATINAGLLCGNTPAAAGTSSGGVQNLVRFLEDWRGRSVVFNGSLGQLFTSKHFSGQYRQPGTGSDPANPVYLAPTGRTYNFDKGLTVNGGPPGSPQTTGISRGRFYYW